MRSIPKRWPGSLARGGSKAGRSTFYRGGLEPAWTLGFSRKRTSLHGRHDYPAFGADTPAFRDAVPGARTWVAQRGEGSGGAAAGRVRGPGLPALQDGQAVGVSRACAGPQAAGKAASTAADGAHQPTMPPCATIISSAARLKAGK